MGLKQNIVIKNEYSTKTLLGGTRGGTPGHYVERYMARKGATESITPVRLEDTDSYVMHYMAREGAVDKAVSVGDVKEGVREGDKLGGIAFGFGEVSLSHKKLKESSKAIQKAFEKGKTVLKTVLSFDEDYLRKHGLVKDDFVFERRGDYRGNIDQMKLRRAIMHGLDRMGRDYDDLQYIGVIQVDTAHVHCHLTMVDIGKGYIMADGFQRGKLTEVAKRQLRYGIELSLDQDKHLQHLASNVTHDKRNVKCYVKQFAHRSMRDFGGLQFLLACLPEDEKLWRVGTNRVEMQKANALAKYIVEELFKQKNSGYDNAMQSVYTYANERLEKEGLDGKTYRGLIEKGRSKLVDECVNSIYSTLRTIPKEKRTVRTPTLDVMSMDFNQLQSERNNDPLAEFGFRLRSYSNRLKHHKKEYTRFRDQYNTLKDRMVSDKGRSVVDYLECETRYNELLMAKYHHFLAFLPPKSNYSELFHEVMDYGKKRDDLKAMIDDENIRRMQSENAENYGLQVYGQKGGRYVKETPFVLEERLQRMDNVYTQKVEAFKSKLALDGLSFDGKGVKRQVAHDFDDVKALDLHHLTHDWVYDIDVSYRHVMNFVEMADERYDKFMDAKMYLDATGQSRYVSVLPEQDVVAMKEYADKLRIEPVIHNEDMDGVMYRRSGTFKLDTDYKQDVEQTVKNVLQQYSISDD